MGVVADGLVTDFNSLVNTHGVPVVVRFRDPNIFLADYDDYSGTFLAGASGTGFSGTALWNSIGTGPSAGEDIKFLEQGVVTLNDSKLYMTGSLAISGNSMVDIVNSGTTFSILQIIPFNETGSTIYRKVFVRRVSGI